MRWEVIALLPVVIWLGVCAWQDWKRRVVSNWMTLPPVALAILLRLMGMGKGTNQEVLAVLFLLVVAWLARVAGGADVKASMALAVFNPALAGWAWMGAIGCYVALRLAGRTVKRFPGMVGFWVGDVLFVVWDAFV